MKRMISNEEVRDLMHGLIELTYENMDQIQKGRFDIEIKPDGSPVTQSDLFVESLVKQYVEARLLDVTFVGEENFTELTSTVPNGYYAILDPIDGTENFCSGLKEWGISFTLWCGNNHLGSLLFLPEMGEHY